jgi:hypothetical protein
MTNRLIWFWSLCTTRECFRPKKNIIAPRDYTLIFIYDKVRPLVVYVVIVSGEDTLVMDRRIEFKRFVDGQTHWFVLTPITDGQMQYLSRL